MIAGDKPLVIPVMLVLGDDINQRQNIRFYLSFLFDFEKYDLLISTHYEIPNKKYIF